MVDGRHWVLAATMWAAGCAEYNFQDKLDQPPIVMDSEPSPVGDDTDVTTGTARFLFEPEVIDFGYVEQGALADATVTVTNTGDAPGLISELSVLGSPRFTWSTDPTPLDLAPGASGQIIITYTPEADTDEAFLSYLTTDTQSLTGVIELLGTSENPALDATPRPLVFDDTPLGEIGTTVLTLENPGNQPVTVDDLVLSDPVFTLDAGPLPLILSPGETHTVEARFQPTDLGPSTAQLELVSDARVAAVPVTLQAEAVTSEPTAVCEAAPSLVDTVGGTTTLRGDGSSDPAGRTLTYAWTLTQQPTASALSLGGSDTEPNRGPLAPERAGTYEAQLVVTNDQGLSSATCTTTFEVAEIRALEIFPDPITFGDQAIDAPEDQTVQLANAGNTDVIVTQAITTLAAYEVQGSLPVTLAPGALTYLTVRFTPTDVGPYPAELVVTSDAPEARADITGEGVAAPPVARCSASPAVLFEGESTTLVGSLSSDPQGRTLTYDWTWQQQPQGSTLAMPAGGADRGPLTPEAPGVYVAQLTIESDLGLSDTCTTSFELDDIPPAPADDCVDVQDRIYVVERDNDAIYTFNPNNLGLQLVSFLDCDYLGRPASMAVSRDAHAYVRWSDNEVYDVDLTTGACSSTAYGNSFGSFGMGFATDNNRTWVDQLYIANDAELARLDTSQWSVSPIGSMSSQAELTGNADGELWAFLPLQARLQQLDKDDASVIQQLSLAGLPNPSNIDTFAFATWGSEFWLFVRTFGLGNSSDVYRVSSTGQLTLEATRLGIDIVGAGVSTCVEAP